MDLDYLQFLKYSSIDSADYSAFTGMSLKTLVWFPVSTRPRSFEGTGRQGSDLLTPGQKPAKLLKLLSPYLENRLSVACVQPFFHVNLIVLCKLKELYPLSSSLKKDCTQASQVSFCWRARFKACLI